LHRSTVEKPSPWCFDADRHSSKHKLTVTAKLCRTMKFLGNYRHQKDGWQTVAIVCELSKIRTKLSHPFAMISNSTSAVTNRFGVTDRGSTSIIQQCQFRSILSPTYDFSLTNTVSKCQILALIIACLRLRHKRLQTGKNSKQSNNTHCVYHALVATPNKQ
jgi:hypothetical protein